MDQQEATRRGAVAAGRDWHNRPVLKSYFAMSSKAEEPSLRAAKYPKFDLELEKAREVPRWRESDVFTPLERDVMGYAEAMSQTPPAVTDEMSARLLDQLGTAAMVELTAFISLANFITRSNVAFGIE